MILLKGFFRKKTTKIYLGIFVLLLSSVLILYSFSDYYKQLSDNLFSKSSYVILASKTDNYDILEKNTNVSNIERALLFKPDYSYEIGNSVLTWSSFLIMSEGIANESILILSSENLKENEIALGLSFKLDETEIDIVGNKIGIFNEEKKMEFIVTELYESLFPEMRISNNLFQQLYKQNNLCTYKLTVENSEAADSLVKNLKKLEKKKNGTVFLKTKYNSEETLNNYLILERIVNSLNLACNIAIFIISIIFFSIIRNIIKDDYKSINVNILLGYTRRQIKKDSFFKIIILGLITFLIVPIISSCSLFIINKTLQLNLIIFNQILLLKIFVLVAMLIFLTCFFSRVKNRK